MLYLRHVGIFTVAQAAAAFLAFLYTVMAARLLGVTQFGFFQALMGLYGVATIFALPLNLATIHCVGVSEESHRPRIVGEFIKLAIIISGACAIVLICISPWLAKGMHVQSLIPFWWTAALVMTTALLTTFYGVQQGLERYGAFSIVKVMQSLFCLLLGVMLMMLGFQVAGAMAGYAISMMLMIAYFMTRPELLRFEKGFHHLKSELPSVVWIMGVFGVLLLVENAPVVYARIKFSEEVSGVYGALYSLRHTVYPFAFAITLPFYSQLIAHGRIQGMLEKATLLVSILSLGFILIGILCPEWVIGLLYGEEYLNAADYMMPYGIALFFQMACMLFMFYQIGIRSIHLIHLIVPALVFILGLAIYGNDITGLILAQILSPLSYFAVLIFKR